MKSQKFMTGILMVAVAVIAITACNTGAYKGFKKTSSGIYYQIKTNDNTDTTQVAVGKLILLDLKYGLKDSVFFDSKTRQGEMRFPVQESKYEGDFYEALSLFHQGDSGTFILKAGPFFEKTIGQPTLPPDINENDDIYFDINVKKVQTQEEMQAEEAAKAEELKQQEGGIIADFIKEKNITVEPDTSGIYFIEKVKGTGKSPETDDYATVHFTVYRLSGEKLFSTLDSDEPLDFKVGSRFENVGFQNAVRKMHTGGKADVLVPSAKAFGERGMGNVVPPFTPLFYEIELVNIMDQAAFDKKQQAEEAKAKAKEAAMESKEITELQKYLKDNNITEQPTATGLVYIETTPGTGKQAESGKKVKVHYTGTLLDGTKFDSSVDRGEPIEFVLGQGRVIKGWDEGIAMMKEGGKATLIIPSKIGYGAAGRGDAIPPYSTLVFTVELLEVED